VSNLDVDRKKAIERSNVFLVVITKNWVQEPLRIQELEYAKSIGKPIAVAVFDNIDPEPYLKGAKVIALRRFDRKWFESNSPSVRASILDFIMEVKEKLEKEELKP
jgi:hypothetical protein